jgi:DNA-binding MarR family transcriptional regulator
MYMSVFVYLSFEGFFVNQISRLLKILDLVRSKVHRELPLQQLVLFLTVVENPGVTMPELVATLDMPQGTVSRNVKALSHYVVWQDGVAVPHGRNLLRTRPDEENRHILAVYPTGRGEALSQEIARGLQAGDKIGEARECGRPAIDEGQWRNRYWLNQAVREF